eukprot:gb/GEZN01005354.1/.p1 GENE.gb/GEZN01005354.1/~~gb/GEZN01005354.1/.p1  ORF type:complete len:414 (+),score=21.05 gb/GEZN01005354.1/:22-1263(+)
MDDFFCLKKKLFGRAMLYCLPQKFTNIIMEAYLKLIPINICEVAKVDAPDLSQLEAVSSSYEGLKLSMDSFKLSNERFSSNTKEDIHCSGSDSETHSSRSEKRCSGSDSETHTSRSEPTLQRTHVGALALLDPSARPQRTETTSKETHADSLVSHRVKDGIGYAGPETRRTPFKIISTSKHTLSHNVQTPKLRENGKRTKDPNNKRETRTNVSASPLDEAELHLRPARSRACMNHTEVKEARAEALEAVVIPPPVKLYRSSTVPFPLDSRHVPSTTRGRASSSPSMASPPMPSRLFRNRWRSSEGAPSKPPAPQPKRSPKSWGNKLAKKVEHCISRLRPSDWDWPGDTPQANVNILKQKSLTDLMKSTKVQTDKSTKVQLDKSKSNQSDNSDSDDEADPDVFDYFEWSNSLKC